MGFNQINLLTKKDEVLYTARKDHGLFYLAGNVYGVGGEICYTVYVPQDSASWMANKYLHLLVGSGGVVNDFGTHSFKSVEGKLGTDKEGALVYLDDDHPMIRDKNMLIKYKNNSIVYKKELTFHYNKASMSPDGKYLLFIMMKAILSLWTLILLPKLSWHYQTQKCIR